VKNTLFPFITREVRNHFESTFDSAETQADFSALRQLAEQDIEQALLGAIRIPDASAPRAEIVDAAVKSVLWQVEMDRKTSALKQLQGRMWRAGYASGELKGLPEPSVMSP
jgi:methionine salvage enolase-phosphatase E1